MAFPDYHLTEMPIGIFRKGFIVAKSPNWNRYNHKFHVQKQVHDAQGLVAPAQKWRYMVEVVCSRYQKKMPIGNLKSLYRVMDDLGIMRYKPTPADGEQVHKIAPTIFVFITAVELIPPSYSRTAYQYIPPAAKRGRPDCVSYPYYSDTLDFIANSGDWVAHH